MPSNPDMITTMTAVNHCPSCSEKLDAATGHDGQGIPEAGDISVCFYCGTVLQFGENLTVHVASNATLQELPEDCKEQIAKISRFIAERQQQVMQ
jgi:hypothetical protein